MIFNAAGVQGADVSFYQDSNYTPQQIDFSKMVEREASFVIVRAGQGSWIDPDFDYNWKKAKESNLPRGSYWFYDSRYDPVEQAQKFSDLFKADRPELELWLDAEDNYNGRFAGSFFWKKFIDTVRQILPDVRIGFYTGFYYITGKISPSDYEYFKQFPLWLAWYTSVAMDVRIPQPWTSCLYWQWGTPKWGIDWGCESEEIDMNLFNGTKQEFRLRYHLDEDIPMATFRVQSINYSMTLRPEHNTGAQGIESIPAGTIMYASEIWTATENLYKLINGVNRQINAVGDKWAHVTSVNGILKDAWVAIVHLGTIYSTYQAVDNSHVIEIYIDGVMDYKKEF